MPTIRDVVIGFEELPAATPRVWDPATSTLILSASAAPEDIADAFRELRENLS